jgi:hypothetical protein
MFTVHRAHATPKRSEAPVMCVTITQTQGQLLLHVPLTLADQQPRESTRRRTLRREREYPSTGQFTVSTQGTKTNTCYLNQFQIIGQHFINEENKDTYPAHQDRGTSAVQTLQRLRERHEDFREKKRKQHCQTETTRTAAKMLSRHSPGH